MEDGGSNPSEYNFRYSTCVLKTKHPHPGPLPEGEGERKSCAGADGRFGGGLEVHEDAFFLVDGADVRAEAGEDAGEGHEAGAECDGGDGDDAAEADDGAAGGEVDGGDERAAAGGGHEEAVGFGRAGEDLAGEDGEQGLLGHGDEGDYGTEEKEGAH